MRIYYTTRSFLLTPLSGACYNGSILIKGVFTNECKDNRSFWVYLLLSIVTCGLYSIYFWYVYVEDLNTIFTVTAKTARTTTLLLLSCLWNWRLLALQTGELHVPRILRPLRCDD